MAGWDFKRDGAVSLDGAWEFYWKRLLSFEDFAGEAPSLRSGFISVPGTWNDFKIKGENIGREGFATYRLRINGLPAGKPLALQIPQILSASKVWVNGKLLSKSGIVGERVEESKPQWNPQIVSFPRDKERVELIVQVSNFHFRSGGIKDRLLLGEKSELLGKRNNAIGVLLLITGGLVLMGLYHLALFLMRKSELSLLYLGIICLLQFPLQLASDRSRLLFSAFPDIPWAFLYMLQLVAYYGSLSLFFLSIRELYPDECSKRLTGLNVIIGVLFTLSAVALPSVTSSRLEFFYDIAALLIVLYLTSVLIRAAVNRRRGSWLMLGGGGILFASIIHDILGIHELAGPETYVAFGGLAIIISQSFILVLRFSRAFSTIEKQEVELGKANVELESRVRERTASLEKTVKEKESLLREVHHRVKNNMQVIVSLLNLQSDNLSDKAAIGALGESRARISSMMLIHENLYKSDNLAMIDFDRYAERIVSEIFLSYGMEKGGIDFSIEAFGIALNLDRAVPCGLILNELTTNAIKHAFTGNMEGKITFGLLQEPTGEHILTIADNGIGLPEDIDFNAGSSLGLRLVHRLVKGQLMGEIEVDREKGTEFTIRFGNK